MAYFAQIQNGTVIQVLAVPDDQEHRGQEFLVDDLGLTGEWIQTSWNARIRKKFAAIGDHYDADKDAFIAPQPFDVWIFNEKIWAWEPPTPRPSENHVWNEAAQDWIERNA